VLTELEVSKVTSLPGNMEWGEGNFLDAGVNFEMEEVLRNT